MAHCFPPTFASSDQDLVAESVGFYPPSNWHPLTPPHIRKNVLLLFICLLAKQSPPLPRHRLLQCSSPPSLSPQAKFASASGNLHTFFAFPAGTTNSNPWRHCVESIKIDWIEKKLLGQDSCTTEELRFRILSLILLATANRLLLLLLFHHHFCDHRHPLAAVRRLSLQSNQPLLGVSSREKRGQGGEIQRH